MIVRFEAIFPMRANLDDLRNEFKIEFDRPITSLKEQGFKDIYSCFRKLIKTCIVDGDTMKSKCDNCKE
jgi:hypothetical protein